MHFSKVFKPNPKEITTEEENKLLSIANITASPDNHYKIFYKKVKEV
jgi:hypothetical protein